MGLFSINKLKKAATDAASGMSEAAKDAVKSASQAVKDTKIGEKVSTIIGQDDGACVAGEQQASMRIAIDAALRLFYFLMSADGTLEQDELDKFESICIELGKDDASEREAIQSRCEQALRAHASSINPFVGVMTCVENVLVSAGRHVGDNEVAISPKLLVWNLLAIGYSDGSFNDTERELVTHVARRFGIDDQLIAQMEDYMLALADLERESQWLKTTNRSYTTIEQIVNEIERRKAAVLEGAQALVTL